MIKRLFWLLVGMGFGFGMSFWVVRALRQRVERYSPPALLRGLADDVRAAAREGRDAMRARERELRGGLPRRGYC
jgi:hypothetical protein